MTISAKPVCRFGAAALAFGLTLVAPVSAANNHSDAGTWAMILLTGPTQIAVPAPSQPTSLD